MSSASRQTQFDFPQVGPRNMYLMYHEEQPTADYTFPELERARSRMTFGEAYLTHLEVLQNVGLTSIEPICMKVKKSSRFWF